MNPIVITVDDHHVAAAMEAVRNALGEYELGAPPKKDDEAPASDESAP